MYVPRISPALRGLRLAAVLLPLCAACPATPYPEVAVDLARSRTIATTPASTREEVLRFSVAAMQSPQDTHAAYSRLLERVGQKLGVEVELVQRRTYQEVNELLESGHIDAALVCTGGYLELERRVPGRVELLAIPVIRGRTTYQSYVIVPAASPARDLSGLAGKRFAFTDELSLSGFAYPNHLLDAMGADVRTFFASTVFTRSHDRSIDAVAKGVVDGAAVDSLVYDQLVRSSAALGSATRVVHRSPPYGVSPVVASTRLSSERRAALRDALMHLDEDPAAQPALHLVGFDRFSAPTPGMYREASALLGGRQ